MADPKVDYQIGKFVKIRDIHRQGFEDLYRNEPDKANYILGPLKIKAIDSVISSDMALSFEWPPELGGFDFVLFADEVTPFSDEPGDECPCSTRDLLHFGHRCGRKAPIDRK